MSHLSRLRDRTCAVVLALGFLLSTQSTSAQRRDGVPAVPPPESPVVLHTAEVPRIRVVPVAGGLSHPWGLAFRPNGDILVTERDKGTLRVIRNGQLLERDIPGVPAVFTDVETAGLMDVAVHPDDGRIVYLTYSKLQARDGRRGATVALARGRLAGGALTEVRDIFVANGWGGGVASSRLLWGADGTLFMTVGGALTSADASRFGQTGHHAQDPRTHFGKVLRLNDDGTAVDDNPFVGNTDYLPEIYSMGHRNQLGLAVHPETGDLWAADNGPQGGDEANIIKPGENYGWPLASFSREYSGVRVTDTPWRPEFEQPEVVWWPSIAPSGLAFYTGEHFPAWQGNLFVGSMMVGRLPRTGHLERVVFNRRGEEIRRESLLTELKQRVRDVRQGPDGYLYVLTEEDDAVLLRIQPAHAVTNPPGSNAFVDRLTEARVPPLPEAEWTDPQRALVERYAPDGQAGNALRTLIRVPALADRVFPFMRYLTHDSTFSARHRAILILRTAWLTQCANLWATHASRADESGLTTDEVRRVAEDPAEGWGAFEAVLLRLADELFRNSSVTDQTWSALSAQYDLHNLMDAVVTVNETTSQAILFNSLGIQPDDDTSARIPTTDVGYRIVVPDREPPLTTPRIEPVDGQGLRITRTFRRHPDLTEAQIRRTCSTPTSRGWSRTIASCSSSAPGGMRRRGMSGRSTLGASAAHVSTGSSRSGSRRAVMRPAGLPTSWP